MPGVPPDLEPPARDSRVRIPIVTPSRMAAAQRRAFISRRARASSTRSLMPATSARPPRGSGARARRRARTSRPCREIVLFLRVVVAQSRDGLAQAIFVKGVDPGVRFLDSQLFGRRVARLDMRSTFSPRRTIRPKFDDAGIRAVIKVIGDRRRAHLRWSGNRRSGERHVAVRDDDPAAFRRRHRRERTWTACPVPSCSPCKTSPATAGRSRRKGLSACPKYALASFPARRNPACRACRALVQLEMITSAGMYCGPKRFGWPGRRSRHRHPRGRRWRGRGRWQMPGMGRAGSPVPRLTAWRSTSRRPPSQNAPAGRWAGKAAEAVSWSLDLAFDEAVARETRCRARWRVGPQSKALRHISRPIAPRRRHPAASSPGRCATPCGRWRHHGRRHRHRHGRFRAGSDVGGGLQRRPGRCRDANPRGL